MSDAARLGRDGDNARIMQSLIMQSLIKSTFTWLIIVALVLVWGCVDDGDDNGPSGGGGGSSSTGGGGGRTMPLTGYDDAGLGLPCDVAQVFRSCVECHGPVPDAGVPCSLVTRADLMKRSPIASQRWVTRSLVRMEDNELPMPPPPDARVSQADIERVAAWVDGGMPVGTCTVTR